MKHHDQLRRTQSHITNYLARTLRPITAYALTGSGGSRVIPGGALVQVTENTDHTPGQTVRTITVHMEGIPYETTVTPDQYETTTS